MGRIDDKTPSNSPSMGRIERMVAELCPEGVEYASIGDICQILDSARKPISKGKREKGIYPYYGANGIQDWVKDYIFDGTFVLLGEDGSVINKDKSPILNWASGKIWVNNHAHILKEADSNINLRFVYYSLQCADVSDLVHGTPPKLNQANLRGIQIPLPPLPIQEAIVEILDKFDRLSAELQAELQARKQQYEYYRNQLLTRFAPEQPVTEYSLGELGSFTKGAGILKSDFREQGYPCIHYGQVHTYYGTFAHSTKSFVDNSYATKLRKANHGDLIIASTSEDVEACCKACAWMGNYEVAVSGDAHIYSHNQNPKYMAYLFQTEAFAKQKRLAANGAKVVRVKGEAMAKFRFVFPSLEEQARIVAILDKFEALVNDLSQGLPAEIAAVQEQYEYYRNKLLTFKTKE